MVLAARREDICNECFVYANRHKFKEKEDDNEEEEVPCEPGEDVDQDYADRIVGENMVECAAKHVDMAQKQQELYRTKKQEAKQTVNESPATGYCALLLTMPRICIFPT